MKCSRCKSRGYVEVSTLFGNEEHKQYNKCDMPGCKHTHNYYVFIRERYANTPKDNVIHVDFRNRKKKELEKETT